MAKQLKTKQMGESTPSSDLRMKYHPVRIITLLTLAGLSFAFITLTMSFLVTTFGTDYVKLRLPVIFHANTIIILVSSYSMWQVRQMLAKQDWKGFLSALGVSMALGIAFTAFQFIGWKEMTDGGIKFRDIGGTYFYLISGLHLLHLIVGLGLMGWYIFKALEIINNPVTELLFETNPDNTLKANMMCLYWHFVDAMWLYLYAFFLLTIYVLPGVKLPSLGF